MSKKACSFRSVLPRLPCSSGSAALVSAQLDSIRATAQTSLAGPEMSWIFAVSSGKAPVQERVEMSLAAARKEPRKTPVQRWRFIETERRFIGYAWPVYRSSAAVSGNSPGVTQLPFGGKSVHFQRFLEMRQRFVGYTCAVSGNIPEVCDFSAAGFYKQPGCFWRCGVCLHKPAGYFHKPPTPNDKPPAAFWKPPLYFH